MPVDMEPHRNRTRTAGLSSAGRVIGIRLLIVVGCASLMGLAFNTANPLGVRPPPAAGATPAPANTDPGGGASVGTALPEPVGTVAPMVPGGTLPATGGVSETAVGGPMFAAPSATTWDEVRPLAEQGRVRLVDVRSKAAYDAGHIPGAVWLGEESSDEVVRAFRDEVGVDTPLVFYCSSTSCSASFKVAYRLAKDFQFSRVQFMTGGFFAYQRSIGLGTTDAAPVSGGTGAPVARAVSPAVTPPVTGPGPLVTTVAPAGSGAASAGTTESGAAAVPEPAGAQTSRNPVPISWARSGQWQQDHGAVLVDTRSASAYIAGHVPGAISLPAGSGDEPLAVFAAGRSRETPLIVYGEARGDMQAFLLARRLLREHGFGNVRFTEEGYREWLEGQSPK